MGEHETKTPGLKWRPRAGGKKVPYWIAGEAARKAGYSPLSLNLEGVPPEELPRRCQLLQAEMLDFLSAGPKRKLDYDGTLGSILDLYLEHENSPFHAMKEASKRPYAFYGEKMRAAWGARKVRSLTGLDLMRWHAEIAKPEKPGDSRKLAAASMAIAVLAAALSWAVVCGITDAPPLLTALRELTRNVLDKPRRREEAPTAEQVSAARDAAHAIGRPSLAFAYALQFEGAIRQWDVIGQWVSLSDPRPSSVLFRGRKWIGPTWADIDADLVLTFTPTKTERTTQQRVHTDLSLMPMVMEELARIPREKRVGPLVVHEHTGFPYNYNTYQGLWATIREKAALPKSIWNRDLRAGGVTEGSESGARIEDTSKLAGHNSSRTTAKVYDRDKLEAARRVATARSANRSA